MRRLALALGLAGALLLAGCSHPDDQPGNAASPGHQPTPTAPSTSASAPVSSPPSSTPAAAGTSTAQAAPALLDWKPLPGSTNDSAMTNGSWVLTVGQQGGWWSLAKGGGGKHVRTPAGMAVANQLLDADWAVVVYQDPNGEKPERAVVTSLADGSTYALDKSSPLPPSSDGSWALRGSTLWYATDHGQDYCLASTDLGTKQATLGWCAAPQHGFAGIVTGPSGTAMLTFDSGQPSCRTVVTVAGTRITPFPGAPACKGAQGALLPAGSVWSVVPNEHQYQRVHVYATTANGVVDLGPGTNSTMTVCGDSVFWSRDAQGQGGTANLMRWDGSKLTIAYESNAGSAFLGVPMCADDVLSIFSSADGGDEQVSARVS
jgi:hypothetical protein